MLLRAGARLPPCPAASHQPPPIPCNCPLPRRPQRPAALHICITAAHSSGIIDLLLRDLREAVATALQVRRRASRRAACAAQLGGAGQCRCAPACVAHSLWFQHCAPATELPLAMPARQDPSAGGDGSAPLYGMAAVVPDRRIVAQFLTAYQDTLLEGI